MELEKEKLAKKDEIRDAVREESYDLINRQRFGLFSQPGNNGLGDDGEYQPKYAKKDEEGAVIIENPNFVTTGVKKGTVDSVLFSATSYNAVGEPYKDPKPLLRVPKDKAAYKNVADLPFKGGGQ